MAAWWSEALTDLAVVGKLVFALALSAVLGWEREARERPAGLRTHMLVGMSAALFVMLGPFLVDYFEPEAHDEMRFDPLRIIVAIVTGISFLGAGTIFVSRRDHVRGLTTAASLLATTGVGMAVALDRWVLAVATTAVILVVLALLRRLPTGKQRPD